MNFYVNLQLYRYSYTAQFTVVDLTTKGTYQLSVDDTILGKVMQLATWGPVNNSIIFVHRSNIFYKSTVTSNDTVQLTTDGEFGYVDNGVPDWVYEGKKNYKSK